MYMYVIPMVDQYGQKRAYIGVSKKEIRIEEFNGCMTKEEVIKAGRAHDSSFRGFAGGKVRPDDPALGSLQVINLKEDESKRKQFVKEQINKINELERKEQKDYDNKLDILQEVKTRIAEHLGEFATEEEKKELNDIELEIASLTEKISNYNHSFKNGCDIITEKEQEELEKYNLKPEEMENVSKYTIHQPISPNFALVCETKREDIDLSALNGLNKEQMLEVVKEIDPDFKVRGGVMYKNDDPSMPKEATMYAKVDPNQKRQDSIAKFANAKRKELSDKYNMNIDSFMRELKDLIVKKSVIKAQMETDKGEIISGMSNEEIVELRDQVEELLNMTINLHEKKTKYYSNTKDKLLECLMEGKIEEELVVSEPFSNETQTMNNEINEIRNNFGTNLGLSDYATGLQIPEVEISEPELEEKIEILPEEDLVINGGNKIPIRSGDDIIGYLDNDEINKPKEVKEEPKDDRVRVNYGGRVEYLENLKTEIVDKKKAFNPDEVDLEITSSKGGK